MSAGWISSDKHIGWMRNVAESKILGFEHLPKIAIFDNNFGRDHFLHSESVKTFYRVLNKTVQNMDCILLVRSKRGQFLDNYERFNGVESKAGILEKMIDFPDKGDLGPGFVADVVICHSLSSLACISGSWGSPTIMFDPECLINPIYLNENFHIPKTKDAFSKILNRCLKQRKRYLKKPNNIDPYVDGCSVMRMEFIMQLLLNSADHDKGKRIMNCFEQYNKMYCKAQI